MFPLHLSDLPLPPTYYSALQRAGYELETELLLTPLSQVQSKLKHASSGGRRSIAGARVGSSSSSGSGKSLSARQIESIVNEAAHHLAPKSRTCAAVLHSEGHDWEHANRAGESEQASPEVGTQEQGGSTAARAGLGADHLSVGDDMLDDLLGGGVRCGMLTEVVGESSSGKTQLLLQLAAATALGLPDGFGEADSSALSGGVAIMTPNGRAGAYAIVKRLSEIGDALMRRHLRRRAYRARKRRRYDSLDPPDDPRGSVSSSEAPETSQTPVEPTDAMLRSARQRVLENVHIACIGDVDALSHAVQFTLPGLIERLSKSPPNSRRPRHSQAPLKLIIIDDLPVLLSVNDALSASAASASKGMRDIVTRARTMIELTDQLKRVALLGTRTPSFPHRASTSDPHPFALAAGIAVVVSNHVMDAFEKEREIALRYVQECIRNERRVPIRLDTSSACVAHEASQAGESGGLASVAFPPTVYGIQSAPYSGLLATSGRLRRALQRQTAQNAVVKSAQMDRPSASCTSYMDENELTTSRERSSTRHDPEMYTSSSNTTAGNHTPSQHAPQQKRIQATPVDSDTTEAMDDSFEGACSDLKIACLGQSWTNSINVRLFLSKSQRFTIVPSTTSKATPHLSDESTTPTVAVWPGHETGGDQSHDKQRAARTRLHQAALLLSPHAPAGHHSPAGSPKVDFVVTREGIQSTVGDVCRQATPGAETVGENSRRTFAR